MSKQIDQIKQILLQHKGACHPVTSAEIARILNIAEDDTHAKTRALIFECAEQHGLPLAGGNRGYYLITSQQEYDAYMANLRSRISGIKKRMQLITKNYKGIDGKT